MGFLKDIQSQLEEWYGAPTGLDIADFVVPTANLRELGQLVVHDHRDDLEIALLLDRDILAAWDPHGEKSELPAARALSVPFEEVSHFVYLSFNHNRRRNVTALEMEMQSEVDRIFLAFHGDFAHVNEASREALLRELLEKPYQGQADRYEEGRRAAARFVRHLAGGDPRAWGPRELRRLRDFFHSDLSEKLALSRKR